MPVTAVISQIQMVFFLGFLGSTICFARTHAPTDKLWEIIPTGLHGGRMWRQAHNPVITFDIGKKTKTNCRGQRILCATAKIRLILGRKQLEAKPIFHFRPSLWLVFPLSLHPLHLTCCLAASLPYLFAYWTLLFPLSSLGTSLCLTFLFTPPPPSLPPPFPHSCLTEAALPGGDQPGVD